ncbi:MAG: VCBS repeat-containing protein [Minicystis sp.]
MSPWGGRPRPSFADFVPQPDLQARLASIDTETAAHGLARSFELRVDLPKGAGTAVIRGYDGTDVAGRPVHAVRVATPLGVVMAVGPLDVGELDRRAATELVPALVGGEEKGDAPGAYRTGTDLNGDGLLDVVLRNEAGVLSIWHFDRLGSGAYEIEMLAPPTRALDLDGDGRIDFEGEIPPAPGDAIAPRFRDVATFAGGRYVNTSPAARAWHTQRARAGVSLTRDEVRLRATLERAWHTVLSGDQPVKNVLETLRNEVVPEALRAAFDRHARGIAGLPAPR